MNKRLIISLFFFCLFISNANSQVKKLFVETGISANSYKGSFNNGFGNYTSSFHLGIRFCKKQRFNGRINLSYGHIDGQTPSFSIKDSKDNLIYPNNYFNTSLFTINYDLIFNIWSKKKYLIYLGAGAGVIRFDVKDQDGNSLRDNLKSRDTGEDYSNITGYIPVFIGFNYILKKDIRLGFQVQLLNPQTDYLDNASKWSPYITSDNVLAFKFFVSAPIFLSN